MIRTGSYYAYNADDGSFLACGSSKKMWGFFGISTNALRYHLNNDKIYNSRKYDLRLKIKWVDGVIEDIEPTIKLKPKPILQIEKKPNKLKCNFIEVFRVFKEPRTEEEKEYMRTHFSIIDLNRVYFKMRRAKTDGYSFKISFYAKRNPTTLVHTEYYYSEKLAEQRIRYLQEFAAKREFGDFWYNNNYYDDIGRIVYVTRLRNGNNLIQSLDGVQMNNTNRAKYLDLVGFLQHEYIR